MLPTNLYISTKTTTTVTTKSREQLKLKSAKGPTTTTTTRETETTTVKQDIGSEQRSTVEQAQLRKYFDTRQIKCEVLQIMSFNNGQRLRAEIGNSI